MEASDVHLQWLLAGHQRDALHDELEVRDRRLAHIAGLPIAGATPDSGNAVERKPPIGELFVDETAEDVRIHDDGLSLMPEHARFTPGSTLAPASTHKPKVKAE